MKARILFISSWYPNPVDPTHGIFVRRIAQAAAMFHDVAVIHVFNDGSISENFRIESKVENNVFELNLYYKRKKKPSLLKFLQYRQNYRVALDHLLREWGKPDLLQLNIAFPAGVAALDIARRLRIPMVLSEHWTGYQAEDGSYAGLIRKYYTAAVVRASQRIITVSKHLRDSMIAHGLKGHYRVIPNVVDTHVFRHIKNSNAGFRFLHVSSLEKRQKNVAGIISAFKELHRRHRNAELVIAGEGPERQNLENCAGDLLNRSIFFIGNKFDRSLAAEFQASDCFVLFSNFENLPVVLLEAICCGVPVITTDAGGITEFIGQRQGLVVKAGDVSALRSAMEEMIKTAGTYPKEELERYGHENFSFRRVGREYSDIYTEILTNE